MKPKTKKKLLDYALYLLLLLACILLIINFFLFRTDSAKCVRNTKRFLIGHFEDLTGGNITCTCLSDHVIDLTSNARGGGYRIIFSSFDYKEGIGFTDKVIKNITTKKNPINFSIKP